MHNILYSGTWRNKLKDLHNNVAKNFYLYKIITYEKIFETLVLKFTSP